MSKLQFFFLLGTALLVLGVIIGPYKYQTVERYGNPTLVRISRWSGQAEYLNQRMGWLPLDTYR
jgi:hypothetical protein